MTDFVKAFKQGLEAAEKAEIAKREISDVFADLNRQISQASAGNIEITTKTIQRPQQRPSAFSIALGGQAQYRSAPSYDDFIVAMNPLAPKSETMKLALWDQDPSGYPCTITVGSKKSICTDRRSLENALADMLRDPEVGESFEKLLRLNKQTMTSNATDSESSNGNETS